MPRDSSAHRMQRLPDPGSVLEEWVECPECDSSNVSIVRGKYGGAESYGLACDECGAHTGSDFEPSEESGEEDDLTPEFWPLPTLSEWRRRTWYGRFKLLLSTPISILTYVLFYATMALALSSILLLMGITKVVFWLASFWPSTYKDGDTDAA